MKRTDAELIEVLESMGTPWQQHFVFNNVLVGYYDGHGRLFAHVIEDDELNRQHAPNATNSTGGRCDRS
jgi:hypothetical protein